MFIERLEKQDPIHLQVVEDHLNLDLEDEDELIQEAEDTLTILHNYVHSLDTIVNKEDVSSVIGDLYAEALTIN